MVKDVIKNAKDRMDSAIQSLSNDLGGIRTGRATPSLVDKLQVMYYGAPTPLSQIATVSIPEPRTVAIKPFDAQALKEIERAILGSDLRLTPNNDGKVIRLMIPPLNEERRREIVKQVKARLEEARVAVRNIRRDAQNDLRKMHHDKLISEDEQERGQKELQEVTDKHVQEIEKIGVQKEAEVLKV